MDFMPRVQQVQPGDVGAKAVQNFSSGNLQMPEEIMKHIAMMRALQGQGMNPQQAIAKEQNMAGLTGLSPQALTALQALMVRNSGPSNYPLADTRARQAVDVAYNPM